MKHTWTTKILAAVGALVALAGCASATGNGAGGQSPAGPASTTIPTPSVDAALAALVPAQYKDATFTYATDATYPPNEYTAADGKTMIGWEIELGNFVAAELGLKASWVNTPFDSLIPGLQAGKYQASFGSFTVTADREKVVDMVSYYQAGESLVTAKGNPKHLTPDSLCGASLAVQVGNIEVDDAAQRSKTCQSAGKAAIKVTQYQLQSDVTLAVIGNKVDAMLLDSPVAGWIVKRNADQLVLDPASWSVAPYGVVLPKTGGHPLAIAFQKAIQKLIDDGTYRALLTKYGVQSGAITQSAMNPSS